jgi:hypothetical protein
VEGLSGRARGVGEGEAVAFELGRQGHGGVV